MLKSFCRGARFVEYCRRPALGMIAACLIAGSAHAGEVKVAVAANFTQAAKEIGGAFEEATGHKAIFSFGSTGQLYTQITQEAPFEVFLAADRAHPKKAADEGLAVAESLFTYATGRIVLFSKDKDLVTDGETLKDANFTRIAIANPATAPYGAAAVETMKKLGVYEALEPKIVQGNNIAQTYQFVETGNAELGFVALAQVVTHDEGSRWIVPEDVYSTIAQDAVLLKMGEDNEAPLAFLEFLRSDAAKAVKEKYGYGAGNGPSM
jgi:molybdate transport system substrate-binding protein